MPGARRDAAPPASRGLCDGGRRDGLAHATDYNEAIQNPQVCFADADLREGHADGLMGLPLPFSGNFADVYKMLGPNGKNWAVKCFTREVQGLHDRYQAISDHLQERSKPFMVEFQYLEQGIKVKGAWFPIVKMSWVEGFALNEFVAEHAGNRVCSIGWRSCG